MTEVTIRIMRMKEKRKSGWLGMCRTLHGWLGIFVVPWVILIGATGFYLNHGKVIGQIFFPKEFSEKNFGQHQPPSTITRNQAHLLGERVWPADPIKKISEEIYHGRRSFMIRKNSGTAILSIPTGHYYLKTRYKRHTYSPAGQLLNTKTYWGAVLKDIHRSGWLGGGLGTWIADAISLAMVVFGITGTLMWSVPKFKRIRHRR